MSDTTDRLRAIVVEYLGVTPDKVTDAATFEALGADSLDVIELTIAVEEEFHVEISDDTMDRLVTFGGLVQFLRESRQ